MRRYYVDEIQKGPKIRLCFSSCILFQNLCGETKEELKESVRKTVSVLRFDVAILSSNHSSATEGVSHESLLFFSVLRILINLSVSDIYFRVHSARKFCFKQFFNSGTVAGCYKWRCDFS